MNKTMLMREKHRYGFTLGVFTFSDKKTFIWFWLSVGIGSLVDRLATGCWFRISIFQGVEEGGSIGIGFTIPFRSLLKENK